MIKGAIGIVGLGVVMWAVGCGTHSGIGTLGMGGNGGEGVGTGGQGVGLGGDLGIGGQIFTGFGGDMGSGGQGIGGQDFRGLGGQRAFCPGTGGAAPSGGPKTLAFAAPTDYDTGGGAYAVTTGDLNGDGKLDLVLLDQSVGIRVMFNNGNGTFAGPADLGLGPNPSAIAVGDVDGNGTADIVGVSPSGVSVILNKGNAAFATPVTYIVGSSSVGLALGDLNGDGKVDIAVADQGNFSGAVTGDIGVLLNNGGGTFVAGNYSVGRPPEVIAIGDLDNDCLPDLAAVGAGGVTVLLNRGSGQFPTATDYGNGTSGTSVAIGDLNGDGILDVVEGTGGYYNSEGTSYVLLNHGGAIFNAPIVYTLTGTSTNQSSERPGQSVALADMDGDGRVDLLSIGSCCGLGVLLNHGDGTFSTPVNFPTPLAPAWLASGDLNGDGRPDVAVVSNDGAAKSGLRVFINTSH